jgi:hypothetical protein
VARFSEDPAQKKATMAHRVLIFRPAAIAAGIQAQKKATIAHRVLMGPGHFFGGAAAAIARMSLISRYSVRGKSVKDSKPRCA